MFEITEVDYFLIYLHAIKFLLIINENLQQSINPDSNYKKNYIQYLKRKKKKEELFYNMLLLKYYAA